MAIPQQVREQDHTMMSDIDKTQKGDDHEDSTDVVCSRLREVRW
jgi:hypothetical protein